MPRSFGIQPGLAVVRHLPEESGLCSLGIFTFDEEGRVTVTSVPLEREQVLSLHQALEHVLAFEQEETDVGS